MKTAQALKASQIVKVAVLSAGLFSLSACMTPTPYQAISEAAGTHQGYSEEKIETNRYRLKFAGNSVTKRETVEDYMLYRAAELTLEQGYDWFSIVTRDTHEDKSQTTTYRDPFDPYGRVSWRYYRGGWSGWGIGIEADTREYSRYEASAEILMGKGQKPENDKNAFDARDVEANLKARVQRPSKAS